MMGVDRRKFVKIAGLTALGLAAKPPVRLFGQDTTLAADPNVAPAGGTIPEQHPLTGKRWAMVVDLKKCMEQKNCTKCIDACDHAHNVPRFPKQKDEVKWVWKEPFEHAFNEQELDYINEGMRRADALLMCNHCDNPPCVRVCPTQATFKREEDGIVMMDWHRCIGCRYCIAACPYGSRSFNFRDPRGGLDEINPDYPTRMRGVVEKCTFCDERLARGEMPSCVEACEAHALTFGDLEAPESEVRELLLERFALRRKPSLGTQPEVYYIV